MEKRIIENLSEDSVPEVSTQCCANERANERTRPILNAQTTTKMSLWTKKTFPDLQLYPQTPSHSLSKHNPFTTTGYTTRLLHPLQHYVHYKMHIDFTLRWGEGRLGLDEITNLWRNTTFETRVLYFTEFTVIHEIIEIVGASLRVPFRWIN